MLKRLRKLFGTTTAENDPSPPAVAPAPPTPPVEPPPVHHGPAVVHRPIPEPDLDPDAVRIIRRLTRFDHTAYLVGGCVRDLLLDRVPKDFDIGTSATPRQIKRLFSNCRIIGRRFRLAHVYFQNGKIIEVATFRARDAQGDAGDAAEEGVEAPEIADDLLIRDDNIFGTPEQDAVRRDFTVNQLFYDVNSGNVLDHADGLGDLRRRLVRTIGDPDVRFKEDPIRILRAIKFAARLDFDFEPATRDALLRTRTEIPKAAPPRILEELNRFCRGAAGRRSFELMFETGVFDIVLPELAADFAAPDGEPRALLLSLLEALDARADTTAIVTGEIFACLLTPALLPALGFSAAGAVAPARAGAPPRDLVDARLRPIALRLRVSRRDQEHCRQAVAILQRLVPARAVRRAARASLVRRPAFADALVLLRALSDRWGGVYGEALAFWSSPAEEPGGRPAPAGPAVPTPAAPGEPASGRKRRRRGGRGRGRGGEGARPVPAAGPSDVVPAEARALVPPPKSVPNAKLPPVWDDSYFFAALPTVPTLEGDETETDRYGARALSIAADADALTEERPEARPNGEGPAGPRRRRRRRRGRGGGKAGAGAPPAVGSAD